MNFKLIFKSRFSIVVVCNLWILSSHAQVGINNASPHPSSVLDIKSDPNRPGGLLIPRMDQSIRLNMPSPANSLLMYDNNLQQFVYRDSVSSKWLALNPFFVPTDDPTYNRSNVKIGIGITNPSERLHVVGNVKADGFYNQAGDIMATQVFVNTNAANLSLGNLYNTSINGALIPNANNAHNLGNTINRWNTLYVNDIIVSGTIKGPDIYVSNIRNILGNGTLSLDNNRLTNVANGVNDRDAVNFNQLTIATTSNTREFKQNITKSNQGSYGTDAFLSCGGNCKVGDFSYGSIFAIERFFSWDIVITRIFNDLYYLQGTVDLWGMGGVAVGHIRINLPTNYNTIGLKAASTNSIPLLVAAGGDINRH